MTRSDTLRRLRRLTSSGAMKRVFFALLVATLVAFRSSPAAENLPRVSFFQLDVEFDGDKHKHSQWGAADLHFRGSDQLLYFNLAVQSGNSGIPV